VSRVALFLYFALLVQYVSAASSELHEVTNVAHPTCGCEFNRIQKGDDPRADYGSGPQLLVIGPNDSPPFAVVNLDGENTRLSRVDSSPQVCGKGHVWKTRWKAHDVLLEVSLKAIGEGEESCWYEGAVKVQKQTAMWSTPIKGGCGC